MKISNFKLKILVALFSVICYLSIVSCVMAQSFSLSISPPLVELLIKPGKSVLIAYTIKNSGDPMTLSSSITSFTPQGNDGKLKMTDRLEGPVRFNLENADLALGQPFFLKSKDGQQFLLKLRVPEGAPEGDYYYTFAVVGKPAGASQGNLSSAAAGAIGSNILVTVSTSGNTQVRGKIAAFDVLPKYKIYFFGREINLFESSAKIPVVLIVANSGRNLIKPQGTINLIGNFGEKAKYNITPQNILAHSERILSATPSAEVEFQKPVSLALSGFFIGKYKLNANLNFGEGTPVISASTQFYAFPLKLTLATIISITVVIFIIKKLKKEDL